MSFDDWANLFVTCFIILFIGSCSYFVATSPSYEAWTTYSVKCYDAKGRIQTDRIMHGDLIEYDSGWKFRHRDGGETSFTQGSNCEANVIEQHRVEIIE